MTIRFLGFLLFLICISEPFTAFSQTTTYSKNNLKVEVSKVNPCNSNSNNGAITFKLISSSSNRAILVLITGPATTVFPEYELNLTNQNTFQFIPDVPQSGEYDFVIRDPVNTNDFINTLIPSIAGVELIPPPPISFPSANQTLTPPTCNGLSDGSLKLDASGGNGLFSYSIDNGLTFQSGDLFSNLAAGTYQITAKDQIGCVGSQDFIITEPDILTFSAVVEELSCNGSSDGTIKITASGGNGNYQYSSDNGLTFKSTETLNDLNAGTYPVLIEDQKKCRSVTQSITVTEPAAINLLINKNDVTLCEPGNDGTLTATATGGVGSFTYSIDGNAFQVSPEFKNLKSGIYLVTAKDNTGCTEFSSVTINPPPGPLFFFTIQDLKCFSDKSGEIKISGFGGTSPLQYSVNGGTDFQPSGNFSGLSAGVYKLMVKDNKNCKFELTTALFQPSEIVPVAQTTPVLCNGQSNGTITIAATGGYSNYQYSIDNGTNFNSTGLFTELSSGSYTVVVKDGQDCRSNSNTVTLSDPPLLQVNENLINATCANNDGIIRLTISGGTSPFTYEFNGSKINTFPAGGIFNGLSEGDYLFKVTDSRGCINQKTYKISSPGKINVTATPIPAECNSNGENAKISVSLNSPGTFQAGISNNPPTAPQNFITVSTGTFQFEGLRNGNYSITINSNVFCPAVIPVNISGGPDRVSFKSEVIEKICAEDRAFIRLSNFSGNSLIGYNAKILSSDGNTYKSQFISALLAALRPVEIDIPDEGEYQVILSQDQSSVTPCTSPISAPAIPFRMNAPGGVLDVTDLDLKISYPDLPTGSISGKIIESLEEPYQTSLELKSPREEGQSFLSDFEIVNKDDQTGEFKFKYSKIYAGDYLLTLKDGFGCIKKFPLTVDFDPRIFIPNIFTPDGDGINDEFFVRNLPPNSKLDITDSWGQTVFSTNNYRNDWSATNVPNGIYYYNLRIGNKDFNGWVEVLTGK